jgi:riboflavin kinase
LKTVRIKGKVFSGSGEGARFTELPWAKRQMIEKLGFTPHPGTLNIRIIDKGLSRKSLLEGAKLAEISQVNGFYRGKLAEAYFIDNLKCAIVVPEVKNYPEDIIELIAPINLRHRFKLNDGDTVEIKITLR